jgi:hypothetical protein
MLLSTAPTVEWAGCRFRKVGPDACEALDVLFKLQGVEPKLNAVDYVLGDLQVLEEVTPPHVSGQWPVQVGLVGPICKDGADVECCHRFSSELVRAKRLQELYFVAPVATKVRGGEQW